MGFSITFDGSIYLSSEREEEPFWDELEEFIETTRKKGEFLTRWVIDDEWLKPHTEDENWSIKLYVQDLAKILKFIEDRNDKHFYVYDAHITYKYSEPEDVGGSILLDANARTIKRVEHFRKNKEWKTRAFKLTY